MPIEEVTPENLASLFFHYQSELAADFGCSPAGPTDWRRIPANERQRMIAAARLTLLDLLHRGSNGTGSTQQNGGAERRPEEGREWGC